jgi:hypothetical protein
LQRRSDALRSERHVRRLFVRPEDIRAWPFPLSAKHVGKPGGLGGFRIKLGIDMNASLFLKSIEYWLRHGFIGAGVDRDRLRPITSTGNECQDT